jgi:hypothetical protein
MSTRANIVGQRVRGSCHADGDVETVTFMVESHDPSHGFWLTHTRADGRLCRHDISERAIGRTFHLVETPDGVCEVCQGSGRVSGGEICFTELTFPCPACGGAGKVRS